MGFAVVIIVDASSSVASSRVASSTSMRVARGRSMRRAVVARGEKRARGCDGISLRVARARASMTTTEDDDDGSLARALEGPTAMTRASSFAASRGREREDEARDDAEETSGGGERDDDDDDESDDATWESESEGGRGEG